MAARRRPYLSPSPEEFERLYAELLSRPPLRGTLRGLLQELRDDDPERGRAGERAGQPGQL